MLFSSFKKNKKQEFFLIMLGFIIVILYLHFIIGVTFKSLYLPIRYDGFDDFQSYANAKNIAETGWVFTNDRLGTPFSTAFFDFPPYALDNIGNLFTKLILNFTDNYVLALNINYYFIPFLSFIIAYSVMRIINIAKVSALCGAVLFSLVPYYHMRTVYHFWLAQIYFIPLGILLCIWCYDGKIIANNFRCFLKNKYNVSMVLMALLIANNGIGYYTAFSCFFILCAGTIKVLERRKVNAILPSVLTIAFISMFFTANFIPSYLYQRVNGKNNKVAQRVTWEPDIYGLKISQMILPQSVPGLPKIENKLQNYFRNAPSSNENNTAYLGFAGSIGFLFLLFKNFSCREVPKTENETIISLLSRLNLAGVLLGTIGGFGTVFAVSVTPMLRGYNRISVYIAFISLSGLFILLDSLWIKHPKRLWIKAMITCFCIFSLGMQFHRQKPDFKEREIFINSDKLFVQYIEKNVPTGAMIYQLPYHAFPEEGPVNSMSDYHELIGFLHSNKLKWSYGTVKGRYADDWAYSLSKLSLENKIKILSIIGFEGIYVDKRAFNQGENNMLDMQLQNILQVKPYVSSNGNLSFYNMEKYNGKYLKIFSQEKRANFKNKILKLGGKINISGIYPVEKNNMTSWRWMDKEAKINFVNTGEQNIKNLSFKVLTPGTKKSKFTIIVNGMYYEYFVEEKGTVVNVPCTLMKGQNYISFKTDAKKINAPKDSRSMYVMLQNINIEGLKDGFEDVLASVDVIGGNS